MNKVHIAKANCLMADGIINGAGLEHWHTSNIHQILINEKYICDALLRKANSKKEYDKALSKRIIQKITVFEDHFNVELKSSVEVDI